MVAGASTPANGPRRNSRRISVALLTMITGSAPRSARRRRRASATRMSTRAGSASNSTLPLAMNVRTFDAPARTKALRSASFFTIPRPPTFMARSRAT